MIGELPATTAEDGKLASERFASAGEVREVCQAMIKADDKRTGWRSSIEGLFSGNAPYAKAALKAKGQGWRANVNYREAEGFLSAPQTAFFDLVTEASPCIEVDCEYGENDQDQADWEESIERNYTWLLMKRWRAEFNFHLGLQQREMLVHGLGSHVWPQAHINNWIPRTPRAGHILFPEDSSVDFATDGEFFMLRDFVPMHTLLGYVRNGKSDQAGWNSKAVWKAAHESSKSTTTDGGDMAKFQEQYRNGDLGQSVSRGSGLWLNYLFVRELDTNKISLYIVTEKGVGDDRDYLFKKRNRFEDWPLTLFPYDVGTGSLHSVRGLGARSKDFFEMSNRLNNTMVDQVMLSSLVMLQSTGAVDPDKMKLMKFGMMGIIPQNMQIAQGIKFQNLDQGPLALKQVLNGTLRENNEPYLTGTPEPRERETATSFTMRAQDSAQVSKGTHGLYGSNLCKFHEKVLPMAVKASKMVGDKPYIKLAKEFVARCKRDGVPPEALDKITEIREVLSTGAGSAAARVQAYLTTLNSPIYLNAPEEKKINLERALASSMFPPAAANSFVRSIKDNQIPDAEDSFAALESDALANGGTAIAASTQNHTKHAQNHLQKAGEIVQMVQADQMDPQQGLAAIQAIGQHVAEHLQFLQGNPLRKGEFEALNKELLALSNIADQLAQHVQEQQESEEQPDPAQQVSENAQIKMLQLQGDEQRKNIKLQGNEQRSWRKLAFLNRVQTAKLALTNGNRAA